MIQQHPMISMHNSIYSKNTIIRSTSMTPQSPRRSPNCRIHNSSSYSSKTRRLRNDTNLYTTRPPNKIFSLPIHYIIIMRHNHNQLNLPPPNRPKITNRLLIRKPYSPSHYSHYNPNTMKLYRSYHSNNRSRTNLIPPILPSKHKLRTNS